MLDTPQCVTVVPAQWGQKMLNSAWTPGLVRMAGIDWTMPIVGGKERHSDGTCVCRLPLLTRFDLHNRWLTSLASVRHVDGGRFHPAQCKFRLVESTCSLV
jgi:hypothetical protein